ncbi:MAG: PH domain-containing protein [Patescibacteria group bacterium]
MSEKQFKDQYDDETLLTMFRRHPVVMRKTLIVSSVGLLLGTVPSLVRPEGGMLYFWGGLGIGLLVSSVIFLYGWMGWYYSVFLVTDQRFVQINQKGLFSRSVVDIALEQIQMVNYHISGVQETLLGFGTLNIQTIVGELTIHEVHKPAHIQKEIVHILREQGVIGANRVEQEN